MTNKNNRPLKQVQQTIPKYIERVLPNSIYKCSDASKNQMEWYPRFLCVLRVCWCWFVESKQTISQMEQNQIYSRIWCWNVVLQNITEKKIEERQSKERM